MRIGVLGLGYWGSKHVRVMTGLPDVAQVVGVDPVAARREEMRTAFPHLVTRPSLAEALDEIDAVVIATKPSTHTALAMQALEAGKHVLVEKPLATSSQDAFTLADTADRRGLTLMVGHTFEYNPAVIALRDIIGDGQLGRMLYLDSARLNLGLFQSDCDVIWDLAPHDVSILNMVLGAVPTAVTAWGSGHIHADMVDNAYLRLDYDTVGVQATVHVSWLDPHKVRRLTAVGSRRMAVYDDLADDQRLRIYDKGVRPEDEMAPHEAPMSYRYGDIVAPYIPAREPLSIEAQHFVDCVAGRATPRTGGDSGLAVVRVLEAATLSLKWGKTVALDELHHIDVRGAEAVSA